MHSLNIGKNNLSQPSERILYLDSLRGLAILAVVLFHAYARWGAVEPFEQSAALQSLFSYGWLGVQLFFAISGYVIYQSLLHSRSVFNFVFKRYVRLAPAMMMASCVIYLSAAVISERPEGAVSLIDFLPSLTFVEPLVWTKVFGLNVESLDGAFWSLYVEVKFYAIAALLFFVLRDRNLYGISALYLGYVILLLMTQADIGAELVSRARYGLDLLGVSHFGWFLVGIYTFKFAASRSQTGMLGVITISGIAGLQLYLENDWDEILAFASLLVLLVFLLPVFWHKAAQVLEGRALLFFGMISYPLYLVHQNLVTGLAIKLYDSGVVLPSFVYPLPFLAVAILLALLITKLEPKLQAVMRKLMLR